MTDTRRKASRQAPGVTAVTTTIWASQREQIGADEAWQDAIRQVEGQYRQWVDRCPDREIIVTVMLGEPK